LKPARDVARDIAGDVLLAWLSKEPLNRAIDRLAVRIEEERATARLTTANLATVGLFALFTGYVLGSLSLFW